MRGLTPDQGNVSIIVAVMLTVLLGAGAIVVDVGAMYLQAERLQAGTDAAALAIAEECALTPALCNDDLASQLADQYLGANAGAFSVLPPIVAQDSSDAGSVTIRGQSNVAPAFAGVLGIDTHTVGASATARWGPVLEQPVFPLAVCGGALADAIDSGQQVVLESYPSGDESPALCDGAPDALPLSWIHSPLAADCRANIALNPATSLDVEPSDIEPGGCDQAINDLLNALADPGSTADERTRVLAIYDAGEGTASHPAHSLIAFEFTGVRIREDERHHDTPWEGRCGEFASPYLIGQLQCIRGHVRTWLPPEDAPIADLTQLSLASVSDTTVLGIRLAD